MAFIHMASARVPLCQLEPSLKREVHALLECSLVDGKSWQWAPKDGYHVPDCCDPCVDASSCTSLQLRMLQPSTSPPPGLNEADLSKAMELLATAKLALKEHLNAQLAEATLFAPPLGTVRKIQPVTRAPTHPPTPTHHTRTHPAPAMT